MWTIQQTCAFGHCVQSGYWKGQFPQYRNHIRLHVNLQIDLYFVEPFDR